MYRLRKLLSEEPKIKADNIVLDLHNSPYHTYDFEERQNGFQEEVETLCVLTTLKIFEKCEFGFVV